jgi:hypothetical protein
MTPEQLDPTSPAPLVWRVHLAAQHPGKAAGAVFAILATVALAHFAFRSWVLCVAAALLLTGAVGEFLFPIRYQADASGVRAKWLAGGAAIAWPRVRRCYSDAEGVTLSPFSQPSRLERWRGVYLRFGEHKQEVLAAIDRFVPQARSDDDAQV